MATINERFKRTYKVLEKQFKTTSKEDMEELCEDGLNLRWLRNEAGLWEDFEEDVTMIIDGCNLDPNHPDNLSDAVWRSFKICKLGWID